MRDVNILKNYNVNLEKSLEILGDMETYDEILNDFLEEMENKLVKSKEFMERKDLENYAILVHALKSAARYLGFEELGELFYKHELEGKGNNFAFVENHFNDLLNQSSTVRDVISRYLASGTENTSQQEMVPLSDVVFEGKTLIVADDSEMIRNIISKIFETETGFKVVFASDGDEVIKLIESDINKSVAGLLLDLNMPNKDGFAVLDYIQEKKLFGSIPVSIFSGNDDRENIDRAFKYPIVDMLRKPFSEIDLKNLVIKTII